MFANHVGAERQHRLVTKHGVALAALFLAVFFAAADIQAQNNFNSGSTGADGAFNPATSQSLAVPASGTFNFTTVNIPSGVTITITRNSTNKPLTILASGDVVIAGTINLDGQPANANGTGGPGGAGGSNGGTSGYGFDQSFPGVSGDGPGGGGGGLANPSGLPGAGGGGGFGTAGSSGQNAAPFNGVGGPKFGAPTLLPLTGGSGGGGGGAANNVRGGPGGGGGGAILIASSGTITLSGSILARGGNGIYITTNSGGGGGGAGGGVRLIANTISGTGSINVTGGNGGCYQSCGGSGGQGYVRLEAYDTNSFTGATSPSNIASLSFPHPVTPPNSPALRIASVGGVNAPAAPAGSLQSVPDIIVPASQPNPVTVALEGANMPLGTVIQVVLTPSRGARTTVQSSGLAGSEPASTASASVTLPGGISVVSALAVIDLTIASAKPLFMEGERVNRIEVAATFGGPSELTYVTQSGRRIKRLAN
jgi:hypothetical protein